MSNVFRQAARTRNYPCYVADPSDIDPIRRGLGMRLASARQSKGFTQDDIAKRFSINKATVSAWETGRGDPGVFRLRELAKLYDVSADALLWEDSLTPDAMKVAVQFDGLNEKQKRTFYAMWMAYVQESATDAEVEAGMPITKKQVKTLEYSGPDRRKR